MVKKIVVDKSSMKAKEVFHYFASNPTPEKWSLSEHSAGALGGNIFGHPALIILSEINCCEPGDILVTDKHSVKKHRAINQFRMERGKNGMSEVFTIVLNPENSRRSLPRHTANEIASSFFKNFGKNTARGLEPWGKAKGMKNIPTFACTAVETISAFAEPFDDLCKDKKGDISTIHLILCPNYTADRTAVTAEMLPHKLAAYQRSLEAIGKHTLGIKRIYFYSLNAESLADERFRLLLNPKALTNPRISDQLDAMYGAYEEKFASDLATKLPITVSLTPLHEFVSDQLSWAEKHLENTNDLLVKMVDGIMANSPTTSKQSRDSVTKRTASDLLLYFAITSLLSSDSALLDTQHHKKAYWDPMMPALREINPDFRLFLLPGYFSHSLAFEE